MRFKYLFFAFFILIFSSESSFAQSYNIDRTSFFNYVLRMYSDSPFEGVRIVEDDTYTRYLLSIVILNEANYQNESSMRKVATIKATSQASKFLNGSYIKSTDIIRISQDNSSETNIETTSEIKEESFGMIRGLEFLSSITLDDGNISYIFISQEESSLKKKRRK